MALSKLLQQLRYRFEVLLAGTPRLYSFVLRSFASPSSLKLLFVNVVRGGDVVFDVGANRGIFTSYFSNLVGARGKVYAFEPSSKTCAMLRSSLLSRTVYDNVVVSCCAIGDARGRVLLRTPAGDDGQASLIEHSDGSWSAASEVCTELCEIVTLDYVVEDQRLGQVDFVKVDVEGAERLVIRGFLKGLRMFKPVLVLELCSRWSKDFGYQPAELLRMLQELGYDHFDRVAETGRLLEMREFDCLNGSGESADVVCSMSSCHDSRLSRVRSTTR